MACSSGCPTKNHRSYGECMKAKGAIVAYCGQGGGDATAQKKWDRDLDAYKDARRQGIQPDTTSRESVDRAVALSDATGVAFQG